MSTDPKPDKAADAESFAATLRNLCRWHGPWWVLWRVAETLKPEFLKLAPKNPKAARAAREVMNAAHLDIDTRSEPEPDTTHPRG